MTVDETTSSQQPEPTTAEPAAGRGQDVVFRNVTKRFGDEVVAVDAMSLDIAPGEFFTLLGPSGSGKSTLLNLVLGALQPDEGEILVGGRPIVSVPMHRRNIGMVFQNYALFPHMTVFKNIAFPLSMRKMGKDEISKRVTEVLELVQLPGFEERYPSQVSGGQQQRIATARAIAAKPPLILMDEPLGALDVKLRIEMQEQLRLLHRSLGVTVIYVTHDQDEAMTLSDRIAVMRDGRIEQVGTPREVYEQPANTWVASFLGDANLIDCRMVRQSPDSTVLSTRGEPHITLLALPDSEDPAEGTDTAGPDERVFLMVRPQRIDLVSERDSPDGDGDNHNRLPATVEAAYFSGTELRYLITTDQGESLHAISSIEEEREEFGTGDRVIARWPVEFGRLLSS
ncbi:MAG: ABC transporter ATP-binding protein [Acidimicrobiaceae bacterium]|nr:ABC transporter ATP-binding protein [Acidimicrobiaceae bacterium]